MGFLSYGSARALAHRHDFQRDIDRLYQREAYRQSIEAEKARKTEYYAQFMKEPVAVAPYNVRRLESYMDDLNNRVADFMIDHGPAVETDINLKRQFFKLTDEYLNNDIIREDMQVQNEFQKLKDNTDNLTPRQWEAEMEKYTNYINEGGDPYIYSNPVIPKYDEILQAAATFLQPDARYDDVGNLIEAIEEVPEWKYVARANADIGDPDIGPVIMKQFEAVEERQPGRYKNAVDMHINNMKAGESVKRQFRAWDPAYTTDQQIRRKNQEQSVRQYPYWSATVAPKWQVGNTIPGDMKFLHFTGFNAVNRSWNLGSEGQTVKVRDKETGQFRDVLLKGALVARNVGEISVEADGGLIRVDVSAAVHPSAEASREKERYFLDDEEITDKQYSDLLNDLNKRKREKVLAGETIEGLRIEKETIYSNEQLYKDAGFESTGVYEEGILDVGLDKKTGRFPVYTGSIWVPGNFSNANLIAYEESFGATHLKDIQPEMRTEGIINRAVAEGNYGFAAQVLSDTYGGNWRFDSETGKFIEIQE